ncbi:MAG: hypothetical protein AB1656_11405 [Candidatus Omnitrophota bacterium]
MKRREFISATAMSAVCMSAMMKPASAAAAEPVLPLRRGMTKTRIGKVYVGHVHPGWPKATVDLNMEMKQFEEEFAKLSLALEDIEFVGGDLVSTDEQMAAVLEKFKDLDGILVLHLTMGAGSYLESMLKLKVPVILFAPLYAGHEWHTIASLQKRGEKIEVLPTSDFGDIAAAVRPFRAIHRLKEAKVLYMMTGKGPGEEYENAIKTKFGTQIKTIPYDQLAAAYHAANDAKVKEDAERWIREAEKIVEPTKEEIYNASRMYLAMVKVLEDEGADLITINCLGLGLMDKGLAYPCLGFSRLDSMGLGGVCEADIKSSITHLIFQYLTGKPGFVSDPVFDLPRNTIIHAHCVSPIKMDGPDGEQCKYIIRNHLEDARGASLQVKMRLGQKVAMSRLIGTDILLYATGEIIDNPDSDSGCRTKIAMKVNDAQHILENWSCGLHRVVFYGDYTQDLRRFCRFKDIRLVYEEKENLFDIPGLEWNPYVHA